MRLMKSTGGLCLDDKPAVCPGDLLPRHSKRAGILLPLLVAAPLVFAPRAEAVLNVPASERAITVKRIKASHFLHQATYGPRYAEIFALADRMAAIGDGPAFNEWITKQFNDYPNPSLHEPLTRRLIRDDGYAIDTLASETPGLNYGIQGYKFHAWWHRSLTAPDQLRQRTAWALMQILVVSERGMGLNNRQRGHWLGLPNYYDMLLKNSFGNYRKILFDVTMHPTMGLYLSHVKNRKGDASIGRFPDENYAREVLQLFSTGIFKLNNSGDYVLDSNGRPIEVYDNETIRNFARVFTGLSYAPSQGKDNFFQNPRYMFAPMKMYDVQHDTGAKTLLRNVRLPAGRTGMQDINSAINNLFNDPNCPPFVARLLIQRFTTSNPSATYVRDVARKFINDGNGNRGNMRAVIRQILMHPEARNSLQIRQVNRGNGRWFIDASGKDDEHGKMREPVLMLTSMFRAFRAQSDSSDGFFRLLSPSRNTNQGPYQSPSVFNFYLPDHQPVGPVQNRGLVAPEFEIYTPVIANQLSNYIRSATLNRKIYLSGNGTLNLNPEQNTAGNPWELMNRLNLMLCYGTLNETVRNRIIDNALTLSTNNEHRVEVAILSLLASPDYAIME